MYCPRANRPTFFGPRPANVHFTVKGSAALASQVQAAIEKALEERKKF